MDLSSAAGALLSYHPLTFTVRSSCERMTDYCSIITIFCRCFRILPPCINIVAHCFSFQPPSGTRRSPHHRTRIHQRNMVKFFLILSTAKRTHPPRYPHHVLLLPTLPPYRRTHAPHPHRPPRALPTRSLTQSPRVPRRYLIMSCCTGEQAMEITRG